MKAVYPGTFDPITNGHIDIIKRAVQIFDHLVIAVAANEDKSPLFSDMERSQMAKNALSPLAEQYNIEIVNFSGLLVDFAKHLSCKAIIRVLRAVSDFEYEFQMSCMNSRLDNNIQTIFLPASDNAHFISSRFVKQIAKLNGDISSLVPDSIAKVLTAKLSTSS